MSAFGEGQAVWPRTSDEKQTAEPLNAATSGACAADRKAFPLIDDPAIPGSCAHLRVSAADPRARR